MLTLDLACPIPWKRTQVSSSSQGANSSSATCDNNDDADDNGQQVDVDIDTLSRRADHDWLFRRYHETLWLGEEHSPLIGFLQHLQRFEKQRQTTTTLQMISASSLLLRNRQNIRRRFSKATTTTTTTTAAATAAATALDGTQEDDTALQSFIEAISSVEAGEQRRTERQMIQTALESGPGSLVRLELGKRSEKIGIGKITKLWLRAMECRELQLQILLVLYMLRLSTRLPAAATSSPMTRKTSDEQEQAKGREQQRQEMLQPPRSDVKDESAASSSAISPIVTKRKRKADHAHRWTGGKGMSAFSWNIRRQNSRDMQMNTKDSEGGGQEEGPDELCTTSEALSKRFESLLDSLCLQIITSNLGIDVESSPVKQSPKASKPDSTTTTYGNQTHPWQMFGSEGRRRQKSRGDKDVLQWLCCNIIEPQFSKTLPRQCGIIRGKCFVPGSGSTPAKATPVKRVASQSKKIDHRKVSNRHCEEDKEMEEERERRMARSKSRTTSQSPAPVPWSLMHEERQNDHYSQPSTSSSSSLIGKWDARTVSVRKKWDRSQSIGPVSTVPPSSTSSRPFERSRSVQPGADMTTKAFDKERVKPPLPNRKESQTLVMATPSKSQASNIIARSNSFSSQSQSEKRGKVTAISSTSASLAAWRKTESQPILTAGLRRELGRSLDEVVKREAQDTGWEENEEEDLEEGDREAGERISTSLFVDESDDEDSQDDDSPAALLNGKVSLCPSSDLDMKFASRVSLAPRPTLAALNISNSDGNKYDEEEEGDDDDDCMEAIITKKRKTLPPSLNFAYLNSEASPIGSRNPFAVSQ